MDSLTYSCHRHRLSYLPVSRASPHTQLHRCTVLSQCHPPTQPVIRTRRAQSHVALGASNDEIRAAVSPDRRSRRVRASRPRRAHEVMELDVFLQRHRREVDARVGAGVALAVSGGAGPQTLRGDNCAARMPSAPSPVAPAAPAPWGPHRRTMSRRRRTCTVMRTTSRAMSPSFSASLHPSETM